MLNKDNVKVGDVLEEGGITYTVIDVLPNSCFLESSSVGEYWNSFEYMNILGYKKIEKEWRAEDLKVGDVYWSVGHNGVAFESTWENYVADRFRLKLGLVFQTDGKAMEHYNKIMGEEK